MEAYWYFDFASPFSYLQLTKVREWRSRMPVTPVPIAACALPKFHHGPLHSPEMPGIGRTTSGLLKWRAKTAGVSLQFPPSYPFNSAAALRLSIAAGSTWSAVETIFWHLWRDGRDGVTTAELTDVGHALGIVAVEAAIKAPETGTQLRAQHRSGNCHRRALCAEHAHWQRIIFGQRSDRPPG